ncbi:Flp family type IVb pilin [Qipengyuania sphaerica]|uniref:Flp family type IVb pilin n=1 Tax=Qipengyuania sphaerica TaxID=2867243 RepID=UPI001C878763|nr:Flp family type IVb pilin [Qipengyuania sphaerica]MBX7541286.1 Flp family type IVb pilin [Qipengyuania sphaerica]
MFKAFLRDESGASAAEYALILALVGAGIALAAGFLGTEVQTALSGAGGEIETANTNNGW